MNQQFISFTLHAVLNSVSCFVPLRMWIILCPACPLFTSFPLVVQQLSHVSVIRSTVLVLKGLHSSSLFYFTIALMPKSSDVKEGSGHNMWKDRLSLVLCDSAVVLQEKLYIRISTLHSFRHPLGGLELYVCYHENMRCLMNTLSWRRLL